MKRSIKEFYLGVLIGFLLGTVVWVMWDGYKLFLHD